MALLPLHPLPTFSGFLSHLSLSFGDLPLKPLEPLPSYTETWKYLPIYFSPSPQGSSPKPVMDSSVSTMAQPPCFMVA